MNQGTGAAAFGSAMASPAIGGMNPTSIGPIIIAACGGLGFGITGIGLIAPGDGNCNGMGIG